MSVSFCAIADEIDIAVAAPHRPRIQAVKIGQLREFLCGDVFDPYVGLISTAIVLAPIDLTLWVVGDPLAVRRESRIRIPCFSDRQTLNVLSVLIGGPDVAQISKGDAAVVITGIANQFRLATESKRGQRENEQKGGCWVESSHGFLLC